MSGPSKNGGKTGGDGRFKPGNKASPGRPKGSRHKASLAVEALLDGQAKALTQAAVEKALGGDTTALRLCLERICPPRKDRPMSFKLPAIKSASDVLAASAAVIKAVSSGEIMPDDGAALSALLETHRRAIETNEQEARIAALEGKV